MLGPLFGEGERRVEIEVVHQQRPVPGHQRELRGQLVEARHDPLEIAAGLARLAEAALARLKHWLPQMQPPWTRDAPLPGGDIGVDASYAVVAIALIGFFNIIGSLAAGFIGQRFGLLRCRRRSIDARSV